MRWMGQFQDDPEYGPGRPKAIVVVAVAFVAPFVLAFAGTFGTILAKKQIFARLLNARSRSLLRDQLGIVKVHDIHFAKAGALDGPQLELTGSG